MKKRLAKFGLLLFVTGTILMPVMHRLELAFAEKEGASHCGCEHHSSRENDNDSPSQKHDPSTCAICQIAMMPMDMAEVQIFLSSSLTDEFIENPAPLTFIYVTPRLIPYSCGPPA